MQNSEDLKFLNLCASLKPGDTICLKDMIAVKSSSWWGLLKRRWNSEDRYVLLSRIDLQLSKIILDIRISEDDTFIKITSALLGLKNLIETYRDDHLFQEKLLEIISKIENMTSLGMPSRPVFNPSIPQNIHCNCKSDNCDDRLQSTLRKIYSWSNFPRISPSFITIPIPKVPSYDCLMEEFYLD